MTSDTVVLYIVLFLTIVGLTSTRSGKSTSTATPAPKTRRTQSSMQQLDKRLRAATQNYEDTQCPRCGFRPNQFTMWQCTPDCGFLWSTFDTHGKCPRCRKQWNDTACPSCHAWSKHNDWYLEPVYVGVPRKPPPRELKAEAETPKDHRTEIE
jgi:hypothetical protein